MSFTAPHNPQGINPCLVVVVPLTGVDVASGVAIVSTAVHLDIERELIREEGRRVDTYTAGKLTANLTLEAREIDNDTIRRLDSQTASAVRDTVLRALEGASG